MRTVNQAEKVISKKVGKKLVEKKAPRNHKEAGDDGSTMSTVSQLLKHYIPSTSNQLSPSKEHPQ